MSTRGPYRAGQVRKARPPSPSGLQADKQVQGSAGPGTGPREGSKAVLGIVSAHAQLIVSPTAQRACPTHCEPHCAENMPSFLTSIFPKTVGITSSSEPASVSRRQSSYNAAGGRALCAGVSTEDRLEAPRGTRGQAQRELCTHKLHSCRRQPVIPDLGPCHPTSLAFGQCVYVYRKRHRQAELFVI